MLMNPSAWSALTHKLALKLQDALSDENEQIEFSVCQGIIMDVLDWYLTAMLEANNSDVVLDSLREDSWQMEKKVTELERMIEERKNLKSQAL